MSAMQSILNHQFIRITQKMPRTSKRLYSLVYDDEYHILMCNVTVLYIFKPGICQNIIVWK